MNYRHHLPGGDMLRKIHALTFTLVILMIVLGLAPLAVAQQASAPPTVAELEDFRRDFGQVLQELDQHRATLRQNKLVREALDQSKLPAAPPLANIQQQLQQLPYDELTQLYKGVTTSFPDWREAPKNLGRLAAKFGGQENARKGKVVSINAVSPDNCQDAFNAAPSWTDWGVTEAFAIGAQGAYEIIPPPLNAIAMAAWIPLEEGANAANILNNIFDRCQGDQDTAAIQTAISNLQTSADTIVTNANANTTSILNSLNTAKTDIVNNDNSNRTAITVAIAGAQTAINNNTTTAVNANTTTLTNVITSAKNEVVTNDNSNRTLIVNNDNANALTLNNNLTAARNTIVNNDNANTTTIVNNDNSNRTAIINNDNANKAMIVANDNANKDLLLRVHIEEDLAQSDSATPVAWFLTPAAQGGHLNLVKAIVTETLANIVAAGGSIGAAQAFLDQANADLAAGRFKDAYGNYRKAYKAAAH